MFDLMEHAEVASKNRYLDLMMYCRTVQAYFTSVIFPKVFGSA
jgi:hypothetical protein